ncbi:MAG TPA: transcription termination/antitermination protein NusA [Clostridiales bacterium]|nr:transcription termination/antitermination protein NusA [Clostridiales bacterium]
MNADFYNALDLLEKEKGIPKDYMIEKIELALANACRKEVGQTAVIRVQIDPVKQDMRVYQQRTVVPDGEVTDPKCEISLPDAKALSRRHKLGGVVETELKTKNFRRLSAQAGKQMIIQAIRDAERERQTREYEDKKEEIITAIVDKVDTTTGNLILDTGTGYATLLKADQIPGETHDVGDRLKVFISEVKSGETRGPLVTLSRVHPNFVKRLFELEIPEIQDGTVLIKGISREAGSRTKIAVQSRDENVDAVGSCIGKNGMRIGAILSELGNEKIDIIKYSDDPVTYVSEALAPAKVLSAILEDERTCRVTVAPDQLSLAIGKEGQNAKLAARLTGYKIDIKA